MRENKARRQTQRFSLSGYRFTTPISNCDSRTVGHLLPNLLSQRNFLWEHKRVLDHLNTDVESWGASWDRPLFDYMPLFYPMFYAALVAAVLCLLVVMFRRWQLAELFVLAWGIGVIVPHTLAETKTPSATMIAVSPLLICLAAVISRAWQRRDWVYTAIWAAGMLAITVISGWTHIGQESRPV